MVKDHAKTTWKESVVMWNFISTWKESVVKVGYRGGNYMVC